MDNSNASEVNKTMLIVYTPLQRSPTPAMETVSLAIFKQSETCEMGEYDIRMKSEMQPKFVSRIPEEGSEEREEHVQSGDYTQCIPKRDARPQCKEIVNAKFTVSIPKTKVTNLNYIRVRKIILIIIME